MLYVGIKYLGSELSQFLPIEAEWQLYITSEQLLSRHRAVHVSGLREIFLNSAIHVRPILNTSSYKLLCDYIELFECAAYSASVIFWTSWLQFCIIGN